jgi:uncharacterized RDD family membrane protein YckC/Tfp pilus assembly protein PilE
MYCRHCGKPLAAGARSCPSCGKAQTVPRPQAGDEVYGHFGRRFIAWIIDRVVVMLPLMLIIFLPGESSGGKAADYVIFGWYAFLVLYYPLMESSPWQGTVGKVAMDLKVVSLEGERIGFFRALWRLFGSLISGIILNIGFLMAAFTEKRQALHDMLAATLVVRRAHDAESVKEAGPAESSGGTLAIVIVAIAFGGVALIGILAAISIPAYQDYVTRSKTAEALIMAKEAAGNVSDFVARHNAAPATLAEAGFTRTSPYVRSIALEPQTRTIRVVMAAPPALEGKAFVIAAKREAGGEFKWRCATVDIPEHFLPKECRAAGGQ